MVSSSITKFFKIGQKNKSHMTDRPVITILIPTFNRKDTLLKCLAALGTQSYPQNLFEVIIINDGGGTATEDAVKHFSGTSDYRLWYFKQEKQGPAAARNIGIENANGRIILFIGDDTIPHHDLVKEHMSSHDQYREDNIAVLGHITWDPAIGITPFMHWLENGGPQFAYGEIKNKVDVDARKFFYTSNISLKKKFIIENSGYFDASFPYAAFEDIELGHRLAKKGLILKYNEKALNLHDHKTSVENFCKRMVHVGESSCILREKIGDTVVESKKLIQIKRFIATICSFFVYPIARYCEDKICIGFIYKILSRSYFLIGKSQWLLSEKTHE